MASFTWWRLRLVYGIGAVLLFSGSLSAQDYPRRPIRIIVPFAAGGPTDVLARLFAPELSASLGQAVIVENRTGGGGIIGTEFVAKAPPDGYTLIGISPATHGVPSAMNPKLPYDAIRDFTFLGRTGRACIALVISPSLPAKTLPEFLAYAKANPGKVNFASAGISTTSHLAGLVFATTAALQMNHIPYRGEGAALTDLMSGTVHVGFFAGAKPYVESGALRVIAVAPPTECEAWPGVAPISRTLPAFEGSGWANSQGFAAPAGLPKAIRDKIVAAMNHALGTERVKRGIRAAGYGVPGPQDLDEYAAAIAHEIAQFKRIVAEYNLQNAE